MSDARPKPRPADGRVSISEPRGRKVAEGPAQKPGVETSTKRGEGKEASPLPSNDEA